MAIRYEYPPVDGEAMKSALEADVAAGDAIVRDDLRYLGPVLDGRVGVEPISSPTAITGESIPAASTSETPANPITASLSSVERTRRDIMFEDMSRTAVDGRKKLQHTG